MPLPHLATPQSLAVVSRPVGEGYYGVVGRTAGHWALVGHVSPTPLGRRVAEGQEALFVHRSFTSLAPAFEPESGPAERSDCIWSRQHKESYGLCNSAFKKTDYGNTLAGNIGSCAMAFCLAAGVSGYLDYRAVLDAALESGFLEAAAAARHQEYLLDAKAATPSDPSKAAWLRHKYGNYDPAGAFPALPK